MLQKWLKELASETFASVMFVVGAVSNVLTFFFPGLPAPFLRMLGYCLLVLGFLLANFGVYKRLRVRLSGLEHELEQQTNAPQEFGVSLSVTGEIDQCLKVQTEQTISATSLEYLTTDGTCTARDSVAISGKSFEIPLKEVSVRAIWNFARIDRNTYDNSGPIKLRFTFAVNGKTKTCILPATILTKMRGSAVWPVIHGSEVFRVS
jgi:hypothetical protein